MSNANETPIFVDMLTNTKTYVGGTKSVLVFLNNQLIKYGMPSSKSNTVIQEIERFTLTMKSYCWNLVSSQFGF